MKTLSFHVPLLSLIYLDAIHCSVKTPPSPCPLSGTPWLFSDLQQALVSLTFRLCLSGNPLSIWQQNWEEIIICFCIRLWTCFWDATDFHFIKGPFGFSRLGDCNILCGSLPFSYANMFFQPKSMTALTLMRFYFLNLPWCHYISQSIVYILHLCVEGPVPFQPFPVSITSHKWPGRWFLLSWDKVQMHHAGWEA